MSGLLAGLFNHALLARDSNCGTNNGFLPGLYDHLCSGGNVHIEGLNDIWIIIGNGVRIAMALAGGLAVIFIIVGGVFYVISSGDPGRIKRAREIIVQAVTGLVIALISYGIISFISGNF